MNLSSGSSAHAVDAARIEQALLDERLRLFQSDVRLTAPGQLGCALLLVAVLWGSMPAAQLLGWLALLLLALGARLLLAWQRRGGGLRRPPERELALTRAVAVAAGAVWGLAGLLFYTPGALPSQVFLIFVLTGMAAGSLTLSSFDLAASLCFSGAAVLPLALRLLLAGGGTAIGMGIMLLAFVGFLSAVGARAQRAVRRGVLARVLHDEHARSLNAGRQALQELSEQLVRKSDALELTLDSMDQGILRLGPDGRVQVFNQRLCELTGLPAAFLAAQPTMREIVEHQMAHGHFGPQERFIADRSAREAVQSWRQGEVLRFEGSYQRRTSTGGVLEVKSRYLPDGGLVRTFTDITAGVEAQARTRRLALVAAHTDSAVLIAGPDHGVEWVNAAFTRLTGHAAEALAGPDGPGRLVGPQTDRQELQAAAGRLQRDGYSATELCLRRSDGSDAWFAIEAQAIRDDLGELSAYVFIARDVSAEREAARALRAARDEAERASRAKSDFLSTMSHELRTPMHAILGFAQLLEDDRAPSLAPHQHAQVQQILRGGRHLLSLINDALDLSAVEAGRQPVRLAAVAVHELLLECRELMQPLAQARGIEVAIDAAGLQGLWVVADRVRLQQVLLNLLSNAVKYNRPRGAVRVHGASDGARLRLCVTDTGPGLDAAQQERLFTAFERLGAGSGPVEGSGLGLALSRQLVALMHGTLGVDSVPGEGSTFWLSLALAPAGAAAPEPDAPLPAPAPGAGGEALGCTVLYIEDNPVNVVLMDAMLARIAGTRSLSAALPEAGLAMAEAERPDLVLLDIQLPGIDGYEVLRRMRAMPALRHTPVVALTASSMAGDAERGLAAGFDAYLTKPLHLQQLQALVQRHARRGLPRPSPGADADATGPAPGPTPPGPD